MTVRAAQVSTFYRDASLSGVVLTCVMPTEYRRPRTDPGNAQCRFGPPEAESNA